MGKKRAAPRKTTRLSVYANLAKSRRVRRDQAARKRAEYLATLPKHPLKRLAYRMHPKRLAAYWFSKRGVLMMLKLFGAFILLLVILTAIAFAYLQKDLKQINPGQLAAQVQTNVTRYLDRNGQLIWQDTGGGNYRLVVSDSDIPKNVQEATVAIEDKNFYHEGGISVSGTFRAALADLTGQSTQGGSTITQQLVKQVYLEQSSSNRGISGIFWKIQEAILAIEVDNTYTKQQILDMYLNESPYGGPRNGIESAAQAYFGIDAKDLTLPEAALLASIPNEPGLYNPYNTAGNDALIARQHKVLDLMVQQGYITQDQANQAKAYPILDNIKPQSSQFANVQAPHFVQLVQQQLTQQLGAAVVGQGGLTITTTLDLNLQNILQSNISDIFNGKTTGPNCYYQNCSTYAGFDDGAGAIEDNKTGELLALVGSRDYNYPGFGQTDAALSFIQPGSSIKPLVYADLFQNKGSNAQNYGSGSILPDTQMTFPGGYTPKDDDNKYMGNITIRTSLAWSRNVPAVEAMDINGEQANLQEIRAMGDTDYCTQGADAQVGLSAAIGGCGTRLVDHVNAMASLARMGAYLPQSTVLKVTNSSGKVLQQYKPTTPKQVIDPQAAYIVSDILSDPAPRAAGLGWGGKDYLPIDDSLGMKVAVKTGTSNSVGPNGTTPPKDIWTVGYTPSISSAIWLGNPTTQPLKNGNSQIPALIFDRVMAQSMQYYQKTDQAKLSDWFTQPAGIQRIKGEVYPSYYKQSVSSPTTQKTFDKVSKNLATSCTPPDAQISLAVTSITNPITKQVTYIAPDGYNASASDNVHNCSDIQPSIGGMNISNNTVSVDVNQGTFPLSTLTVAVDGNTVGTVNLNGSGTYTVNYNFTGSATVTATVEDAGDYTATSSQSYTAPTSGGGNHGSH